MLGYDARRKLYLVKRVQMVNLLPEWEKEKVARLSRLQEGSKSKLKQRAKSPRVSSPSEPNKSTSDAKLDKELKKPKAGGGQPRSSRGSSKRKVMPVNQDRTDDMEEGTYWVPRVRLMFAAEDPRVFADRVAHAHTTRYVLIEEKIEINAEIWIFRKEPGHIFVTSTMSDSCGK